MLETVLGLIPPTVLKALGVGAATVPLTWGIIERFYPPDSSALTNRLSNIGFNVGAFVLLHASGQVTHGVGWQGYLAATTYGLLSTGMTELFHIGMKKVAPDLTRPSGG